MRKRFLILRRIQEYIQIDIGKVFILFMLNFALILCSIGSNLLYKNLIDMVMIEGKFKILIYIFGGYLIVFMIKFLTNCFNVKLKANFFIKLKIDIKNHIYNNILMIPLHKLHKYAPAQMKSFLCQDSDMIGNFMQNQILEYSYLVLNTILTAAVSITINPILAILSIIFMFLSFLQSKFLTKKCEENLKLLRDTKIHFAEEMRKEIVFWSDIKSYQAQNAFISEFEIQRKKISKLILKQRIYDYVNYYLAAFNNSLISDLFIYLVGGCLVVFAGLSIGAFLIFLEFYRGIITYMKQIISCDLTLIEQQISLNSIFDFIKYSENLDLDNVSNNLEITPDIRIENIDFGYEKDKVLFNNLNIVFEKKNKYWLIGDSGVGKSTLLSLLVKEKIAQKGTIYIGDYSIFDLSEEQIFSKITVVSKKMKIFNSTIKENLIIANPNCTEEDIKVACMNANLHEFILSLDKGLYTMIGENGIRLSGGQRQRLLLARAFLRNTAILILDEATSEMDISMETEILNKLKTEKLSLIIVVSHRKIISNEYRKVELS